MPLPNSSRSGCVDTRRGGAPISTRGVYARSRNCAESARKRGFSDPRRQSASSYFHELFSRAMGRTVNPQVPGSSPGVGKSHDKVRQTPAPYELGDRSPWQCYQRIEREARHAAAKQIISRRIRSTCVHCKSVTFARRRPVTSANAPISAKSMGSSASKFRASSRVRKRSRRGDFFSMRIYGTRSSHSYWLTHLRRIARNTSSSRFTVAFETPSASFASVMWSMRARLMRSSCLPFRCPGAHTFSPRRPPCPAQWLQ